MTLAALILSFSKIELILFVVYFSCIAIFYVLFVCKIRLIVFAVRVVSYLGFLTIIVLKPELINPFVGIFKSNDLVEQSRFEKTLNDLNSSVLIKLATITNLDFQDRNSTSLTEINAAKEILRMDKE